jgi:hypothetical protein
MAEFPIGAIHPLSILNAIFTPFRAERGSVRGTEGAIEGSGPENRLWRSRGRYPGGARPRHG